MQPNLRLKQGRPAWRLPRDLRHVWYGFMLLATCPALAAAQALDRVGATGSWHGTSTCVDKVAFPACHDEEVIYDVRAVGQSSDSIAVRADKVVNGVREFMGEFVLVRGAQGEWAGTIQTLRFRLRLTLSVTDTQMRGALVELPSGQQVRAMTLQRMPS